MPGIHPPAVDCGEPGVAQPYQVMHQRRGLVGRVWKPEVIPPLVKEPLKQLRRSNRLGLLPRMRVPARGGNVPRGRMLWIDQIGDEQRSARR